MSALDSNQFKARAGDAIDDLSVLLHDNHLRLLLKLAEADRVQWWARQGAGSMAEWLANRRGIPLDIARSWMAHAHALSALPFEVWVDDRPETPRRCVGVPYEHAVCTERERRQESPTVDSRAFERATQAHTETQNALARFLRSHDLDPRSPSRYDPEFDLAWHSGGRLFVAEVKSLTAENETRQLRLGLGQVLDYAVLLSDDDDVVPVIAVEREPTEKRWRALCNRLGVLIVWPATFADVITDEPPTLQRPLPTGNHLFGPAKVPRPVYA